jgi:hypothetical protein
MHEWRQCESCGAAPDPLTRVHNGPLPAIGQANVRPDAAPLPMTGESQFY